MAELESIQLPMIGIHPGKHLNQVLAERGWTQNDLIFILGCAQKTVNLIINGKQGISPAMSKALGEALQLPHDYFADLQNAYDLACADEPSPDVSLRAKMQSNYPIREMIKRGWLHEADADVLGQQLADFFCVSSSSEVPYIAHAGKKTGYEDIPPAQLAWLFRAKQMAKSMFAPKYSEKALQEAVTKLRSMLLAPEEARNVPRVLNECGVRLVIVESLPQAKIDGVCFWLDKHSPVIGLSLRYDRIDNFWFVLRHEIEHVLRGHGQDTGMIDAELEGARAGSGADIPTEERVANEAAASFCVPPDKLESFIKRKSPFFYERDVIAFSALNHLHPGLAVGQIQHRIGRYDFLKKHLVKIRQFVLPGSMFDGWGQVAPTSL